AAARRGGPRRAWAENILDYFLRSNRIKTRDGAEITWYHAANKKSQMEEAIKSAVHMVEADILLRDDKGGNRDPIMVHPPETDSDNTLQEWLKEIVKTNKGIKLDFKSLEAVRPSLELLEHVKLRLRRPVWINADILPGPNGNDAVVDAKGFLDTVTSFFPDVTLSLGWSTGWHPGKHNNGKDGKYNTYNYIKIGYFCCLTHSHVLRKLLGQIAWALFQVGLLPDLQQVWFVDWNSGTFPEEK
uniref:Menorin-like domain-containing protein n=1 Tax=Dromaius novaehollandiae TaxID=8790 RepID=A0A8C4PE22_DRONO